MATIDYFVGFDEKEWGLLKKAVKEKNFCSRTAVYLHADNDFLFLICLFVFRLDRSQESLLVRIRAHEIGSVYAQSCEHTGSR